MYLCAFVSQTSRQAFITHHVVAVQQAAATNNPPDQSLLQFSLFPELVSAGVFEFGQACCQCSLFPCSIRAEAGRHGCSEPTLS